MLYMKPADRSQRIFAYVIDYLLLSLVGLVVYFAFGHILDKLGWYKIGIGLLLSTTYFYLGNTNFSGGQTLGKRFMRIRVIGKHGGHLHWWDALERALLVSLPLCFGQKHISSGLIYMPWQNFFYMLIGAYYAFDILYFIFRRNGLTYHDIIAESYVAKEAPIRDLEYQEASWILRCAPLAFAILTFGFGLYIYNPFSAENKELRKVQLAITKKLENKTGMYVNFLKVENQNQDTDSAYRLLTLDLNVPYHDQQSYEETKEIIKQEIKTIVDEHQIKKIELVVSERFNIGIFNYTKNARKSELKF